MNHAHIALALAFGSAAALAQPALDFKGVKFGVGDAEAVREVIFSGTASGWTCFGSAETGDEVCEAEDTTFANEPCSSIRFSFDAGKLGTVSIKTTPKSFPGIASALSRKYGPPSLRQTGTVKNAMNASFPQMVLHWDVKGAGSIRATLRDDRIDQSSFFLTSAASLAAFTRKQAAEKAARKPDI